MKNYLVFSILIFSGLCGLAEFASAQVPVDLGILNGKAKTLVAPKYPAAAVKANVSGAVSVKITVDEKGNVLTAEAVSGSELLREASVAAAKASIFPPYLVKGKPAKMSGSLVFNFVAPDPKKPAAKDVNKSFADLFNSDDDDDLFSVAYDEMFKVDKKSGKRLGMSLQMAILSDDAIEEGKYDEAISLLNPAIVNSPKNPLLLSRRAVAFYYKKDLVAAMADAQAALSHDPKQTRALNVRAMVNRSLSQLDLANKDFDQAVAISAERIRLQPGSMDDHFALAETFRLRGENGKAAASYHRVLDLTPTYPHAQKHLNEVLIKHDVQPAKATNANGSADSDALNAIQSLYDKGDYAGAVKASTAKIDSGITTSHYYFLRAKSFVKLYNNKSALPDINEAVKNDDKKSVSTSVKYYVLQGEILNQVGVYRKAIDSYTKAVELDPKFVKGYQARGDLYNSWFPGERLKAITDYTKAVEIDPTFTEAYMARGFIYAGFSYGSFDKAAADFGKVIALKPKDTFAYHQRGYAYYKLNKKAEALADFRKIVELDPKDKHAKHSIEALINGRKVLTGDEYDEFINGETRDYL